MNVWENDDSSPAIKRISLLLFLALICFFVQQNVSLSGLFRRFFPDTHNLWLLSPYSSTTNTINKKKNDSSKQQQHCTNNNNSLGVAVVPFVVFHLPDWRELQRLMNEYRQEYKATLANLSKSLEMAILLEAGQQHYDGQRGQGRRVKISRHIQRRISRLSVLFEEQERVLESYILVPFPPTLTLPSSKFDIPTIHHGNNNNNNNTRNFYTPPHVQSYDSSESDETSSEHLSLVRSRTATAYQNATNLLLNGTSTAGTDDDVNDNNDDNQQEARKSSSASGAPASYDSVAQVVAHLVRDWSELGAPVRQSLYHWCRSALREYINKKDTESATTRREQQQQQSLSILVPGAGLGRLAWELAILDGHHVQALEVSLGMAAAASFVFHKQQQQQQQQDEEQVKLCPYLHDGFQNQVHADDRYESVVIPDVKDLWSTRTDHSETCVTGTLSYTVASFESLSTLPEMKASFDAIVTCFFLDTATNLFQYLDIIQDMLKDDDDNNNEGGSSLWINVGPLQWHANALLPGIAANELQEVLLDQDFEILHWSIDDQPMEYRNPTTTTTSNNKTQGHWRRASTAYNGYCPLRFVARKKKRSWRMW